MCRYVPSVTYWGLRDYGTGEWRGGDPSCDHKRIVKGLDRSTLTGQVHSNGHADEPWPGGVCGLCGARFHAEGIGQEDKLTDHIANLVDVFREVRRVLRDDGICWMNYGDAYAGSWGNYHPTGQGNQRASFTHRWERPAWDDTCRKPPAVAVDGYKPKDLMFLPTEVARALRMPWLRCLGCGEVHHQTKWGKWPNGDLICPACLKAAGTETHEKGWWIRTAVAWIKNNVRPESATDRPTNCYEFIFLMSKSGTPTFWTHDEGKGARKRPKPDHRWINRKTHMVVRNEPNGWRESGEWMRKNLWHEHDYFYDPHAVRIPGSPNTNPCRKDGSTKTKKGADPMNNREGTWMHWRTVDEQREMGSNLRNAWVVPIKGYPGAHFATFPEALAEIPILASTSAHGVCESCGAPWARNVQVKYSNPGNRTTNGPRSIERRHESPGFEQRLEREEETVGWHPTCECGAGVRPAVVLDPFGGAGTSALVAKKLGRDAVLIELKAEYANMAADRIRTAAPLLYTVEMDYGEVRV